MWTNLVLHVITTVSRGGAESHLLELVRGQRARGWRVCVAYLKGDGYWTDALRAEGAEVHALELRRYGDVLPILRLRRLVRTLNPTLLHAHLPPAELYTRLALIGISTRPPLVISKHNDEPFFRGRGARVMGRWVTRRACHVIAISDAVKRYMMEDLGLPGSRVSTVRYGIDSNPYISVAHDTVEALRTAWLGGQSGWLIGTVARLVPQKALHVLLEGYAGYRARSKIPSRLVIVGRGPLEHELKAHAARLGLERDVVWAGFREDIPAVMSALDLFALTSIYEGFGLVLLEAMASSKPVVASAVSAIPEVVADRKTGLLVSPLDPDRLAEAFLTLEDGALRTTYGHAGYERALNDFSLDDMVDRTLRIYEQCKAGS